VSRAGAAAGRYLPRSLLWDSRRRPGGIWSKEEKQASGIGAWWWERPLQQVGKLQMANPSGVADTSKSGIQEGAVTPALFK